jgi:diguanylate cyclase (GGDEF)-like protein
MVIDGKEFAGSELSVVEGPVGQLRAGGVGADRVGQKARRVVAVLVISAAVAVGCLGAGGITVYRNLRQTNKERSLIDHSQVVLTNLQAQTQRLDRMDFNLQLFVATGDRSRWRAAQQPLSNLFADMLVLQELVKDNASQTRHAQDLSKAVDRLGAAVEITGTDKVVPDKEILACRGGITVLQQEERGLLRDRTDGMKRDSYTSFLLSSGYLAVSMMIVLGLFVLLFRDAKRRREDETILFAAKEQLEATVRKLTERAEESTLLTSARDELQLCMTARQAHESVVRHMSLLVPGSSGATLVINNSRSLVEIAATWGAGMTLLDGFNPDGCCGLRAGKARWRTPGKSELHCMHFAGTPPESYLCVPLAAHGETQGFVFVCCDTASSVAIAMERTPLIVEMSELASLSIASLNLRAKLEGQSIRDGLTGLFNRNFMEIALERELHRAARQGTPLAVMMLDVDHFKALNDTFGHEAGDVVLREVADCIRKSLRDEDIICRYGGEEFVVIMPDAPEATAMRRAEMIRLAVSEIRTHFRGELLGSVTMSVGIAMYPESDRDGRNLVQLADSALYRAKHAGRNQVMLESTTTTLAGMT